MTTSNLNKKLLKFQEQIETIKKDGKNPHFKSTYATLTQILSEVKPILSELGLIILQPINHNLVTTVIIDSESGESISSSIEMPTGLNAPQVGSCLTYFRRYNIASLLSLEIADDDGNEASKPTELPYLNKGTENYYKVVDAITNGKATVSQVKTKYKLSKDMETELTNINK
jgi:hypothetical protein